MHAIDPAYTALGINQELLRLYTDDLMQNERPDPELDDERRRYYRILYSGHY